MMKHRKIWWLIVPPYCLLTPWFMQLLISGLDFSWWRQITFNPNEILKNIINNSSTDYLFFQGDKRLIFGTQETGLFYIFQIPLILFGGYFLFLSKFKLWQKALIFWLISGFITSAFFGQSADLNISLFYVLPLEIISFLGIIYLKKIWEKGKLLIRTALTLFLLFSFYEIVIYFHILLVHYPKRLLGL